MTGWKLDASERAQLLDRFPARFPEVVADHVTLHTGTGSSTPLPREAVGAVVGEIDDEAGVQALVVSIGGTTVRTDGSHYHITWSLAPGRRLVESNAVIARLGWRALPDPVPIRLHPARF